MSDQKKMVVLTAPSGAGKTTIARHLIKIFPFLEFSISATTRKPRENEKPGIHYYYFDHSAFQKLIEEEKLAEFEEVYQGQYYGTLKSELDRIWDKGLVILFDVDVRGAYNIKSAYDDQCLSLFIKPPSLEELETRLTNRNTEDEESLKKRLKRVRFEMTYEDRFDHTIVNDDLDRAVLAAKSAILRFLKI